PLKPVLEGRAELLFFDRPGHGWSQRGSSENDTPFGQAKTLAALMDAAGIGKAIIVGHSLGAAEATAFALAYPQRTRGLVLLSAATHPWPGGVTSWYYSLTATPVVGPVFAATLAYPAGTLGLPQATACVFSPNKVPDGYAVTLKPGTYQDLQVKGKVSLQPGNYIIDGGTLKFASQSVITGEGVTFFLLNGAELDLHGGSTFKVTAATTGEWAGFSIVAGRNNTARAVINGNTNSSLTGIIYMPASKEIQFSGNGKTGGECVRIVAQEITMIGNAGFKLDCKTELANNTINNPGAIRLVK
ncbi:MAG TPA: alpha/beta hydrolase, partial [Mycoplana sp.]|nr:alpha/beta hydrolase [Mycoplana sp.]